MNWIINQAVILAGGSGNRLRPLTNNMPKPMVPVNNIPFLDYLINSILQVGIKKILILVGYKSEIILKRYSRVSLSSNIKIDFSIGKVEYRTGRRILNAHDKLDDQFLLLYGDNYWPIELEKMIDFTNQSMTEIYTTVYSNKDGRGEYGFENNIFVRDDGIVIKYDKQRKSTNANGVDIGYFLVKKQSLNFQLSGNVSFEEDIIPKYIFKNQLSAYITDRQYYFITNINTLNNFQDAVIKENFHPLNQSYFEK